MSEVKYVYVVERWATPQGVELWKVAERFDTGETHATFGGFRSEAHAKGIAERLNAADQHLAKPE